MATEQQATISTGSPIDDHDAIAATVQLYIDGAASGDADKLTAAFHPDGQMYGAVGGDRYDQPLADFAKLMAQTPGGDALRARIASIERIGDAATAVVIEEGFWGTLSFVDFFALARIDGRWQIVNKTFAHTGGDPPAGG
jgi:hypothetical protein